MPGSIVFRPIEANLTHNTELIGKMDPYVQFNLGNHKVRTNVCRKGGKHPMWDDSVTLPVSNEFQTCTISIRDKDLLKDDNIGVLDLNLGEIESQGSVKKWFPIFHKGKPAGEFLMEAFFQEDNFGVGNPGSYITPAMTGNMMGSAFPRSGLFESQLNASVPLQTQGAIPSHGAKSLSEQYAEEALLRGIDPLHSHNPDLLLQQPLPTGTLPGNAGAFQQAPLNPKQLLNKDIPVNQAVGGQGFLPGQGGLLNQGLNTVPLAQSGFAGVVPNLAGGKYVDGVPLGVSLNNLTSNPYTYNFKNQTATPIQHGQEVPVGVGIGSDYLTNTVVASNMGTTGHHVHRQDQQMTFGHGHGHPHGEVIKESLNPTTFGPKTNPGQETYDKNTGKW